MNRSTHIKNTDCLTWLKGAYTQPQYGGINKYVSNTDNVLSAVRVPKNGVDFEDGSYCQVVTCSDPSMVPSNLSQKTGKVPYPGAYNAACYTPISPHTSLTGYINEDTGQYESSGSVRNSVESTLYSCGLGITNTDYVTTYEELNPLTWGYDKFISQDPLNKCNYYSSVPNGMIVNNGEYSFTWCGSYIDESTQTYGPGCGGCSVSKMS